MERYPVVVAYAVITVVTTLAVVILAVVAVLLHGLYDPRVDNSEIFKLIGPPFISIVGGFTTIMGALAGYIAGRAERNKADLTERQT